MPKPMVRGNLVRLAGSFRLRMLLLLLLALAPGLVAPVVLSLQDHFTHSAEARVQAMRLAAGIANLQRQVIQDTRSILSVLASLPQVRSAGPECPETLARLVETDRQGLYTGLGRFDLQGRLVCNSHPVGYEVNVADRSYFQRAIANGGFAIGDHGIGRTSGETILPMAVPVPGPDGQPVGVLMAALRMAWLQEMVTHTTLPPGAGVTLLDSQGTVLAAQPGGPRLVGTSAKATDLGALMARKEGAARVKDLMGRERVVGFTTVPDSDLFVAIHLDTSLHDHGDANLPLTLSAMMTMIALVLLAWTSQRRFAGPLARMQRWVLRLEAGDRPGPLPPQPGELAPLAEALNQLAAVTDSTTRTLQEKEERYRVLFDQSPDGMILFDPASLRAEQVNRRALALLGMAESEVLGATYTNLLGTPETTVQDQERLRLQGSLFAGLRQLAPNNAPPVSVELTVWPLPLSTGRKLLACLRDISHRDALSHAAEDQHRRLRQLVDSLPVAVIAVDRHGQGLFANARAQALTGWSCQALANLSPRDLLQLADGPDLITQTLQDGQPRQSSAHGFWCKDGSLRPVSLQVSALTDGDEITGGVICLEAR